jgi:hypothetical protein
MAATTLIPVEEYLRTCYRPDRDFIDGVLVERNVGEEFHSYLQIRFGYYFMVHRKEWNVQPIPSCAFR